ncbi:hypothetical protein FLX27_07020 [Agrobacterium tumefaciens]|nr:hypothetical protein FLX27_07020 [Agrobacterium tumefaciens]
MSQVPRRCTGTQRRIFSHWVHPTPSFLCLSQESSRRASARREGPFQPKDLGWLDLCDKHRDEGSNGIPKKADLANAALA